jgi:hypothetical protein
LQERLRRAQMAQEREAEQSRAAKMNAAVSMGTTILGALFGSKTISASTIGRAGTVARSASRTYKESQDVQRAGETVAAVQQQIDAIEFELQTELSALHSRVEASTEQFETIEYVLRRPNIALKLVCLAWVPEDMVSRG